MEMKYLLGYVSHPLQFLLCQTQASRHFIPVGQVSLAEIKKVGYRFERIIDFVSNRGQQTPDCDAFLARKEQFFCRIVFQLESFIRAVRGHGPLDRESQAVRLRHIDNIKHSGAGCRQ